MQNTQTFEDFCFGIKMFDKCIDNYPYAYDLQNDLYYISEKATKRFRIENNLFSNVKEEHRNFVHADDYDMLIADLQEMIDGVKDEHDIEYRWLDKDGYPVWIHCKGTIIRDDDVPRFMIGCINEIGLVQTADNVTGLRQINAMEEVILRYADELENGYTMRINVDHFHEISQRFSEEFSEGVLRQVSDAITSHLLDKQWAFHAAIDEFVILDLSGSNEYKMEQLFKDIRSDVDEAIKENNYEVVYTISAGVVPLSTLQNKTYNDIVVLGDFALDQAVERGRNQIYFFDRIDYQAFIEKRKLTVALQKGVLNNMENFEIFYQPIVDTSTNKVTGAEALLRFTHEGRIVSPDNFVHILEETGLIVPVGRWVTRNALILCSECRNYYPEFKVNVNLSPVQVEKTPVADETEELLAEFHLPPKALCYELTESGELETNTSVMRAWNHLKRIGVGLALDDFGTGYSNFNKMATLQPSIVKIDCEFTSGAMQSMDIYYLLASIIRLAHGMRFSVCVEGIETQNELREISRLDPDMIQGYLYGWPINHDEFVERHMKGQY